MGLDIQILSNVDEEIEESTEFLDKFISLSRTFCNLMCDYDSDYSELKQVFILSNIDVSAIDQMNGWLDGSALEFYISVAENEEAKQKIIRDVAERKEKMKGNVDKVLEVINELLSAFSEIPDLSNRIKIKEHKNEYEPYFLNFNVDTGKGYLGNNFGQDLRIFKELLERVKYFKGTTVWFDYG